MAQKILKKIIDRSVQYRVKDGVELPVQGGPSQIELLVPKDKRKDYLEIIGKRKLK